MIKIILLIVVVIFIVHYIMKKLVTKNIVNDAEKRAENWYKHKES